MSKCEICGKDGFHKLSCTNQKITLLLEDELAKQIGDLSDDEFEHNCEKLSKHFIQKQEQKQALIDMMKADEKDGLYNKVIPTLAGDEAEDFIRKADENVKLMRQRRCKNHVWRKHYLNGGKVCQVCGKAKEEPTRNKDVEP